MKRLTIQELECLSNEWLHMLECSEDEQDAFRSRLEAIPCTIAMPLGELTNPKLVGSMWILRNFNISRIPRPRPITDKYSFGTQGIEDCIEFEHEDLAYALTLWRAGTNPHRINIFLEGMLIMTDFAADVISVTKTRLALTKLSKTYRSNQKHQADNEQSTEYWDGACQAIADIAAALSMSLEGQDEQVDEVDQEEHSLDVLPGRS